MKTIKRFNPRALSCLRVPAFLILFFLPLLNLHAQSFAPNNLYNNWNGSTAFSTVPTATGLTFSQIFRGSGINSPAPVTSGITSNGWDGPTSAIAAAAANKFFYFTITSSGANPFNVTSMTLALQRSATGPGNFQVEYSVNSAPYQVFGNPFSTTSSSAFSSTVTAATAVFVPAGQNVVFRLVGWNASGATGTCRINSNTAINGSVFSLTTTTVTGAPFCVSSVSGTPTNVSYSSAGTFGAGNVFSAQLSNASGSFASPVTIGTLTGNAATGTINATIPAGTPAGSGYRIRVKSSSPVIDGIDNGTNISIGGVDIAYTVTDIACNGNANGAVTTTINSGVPPFTYAWSTSATTPSISNLPGGTYSLTVTDNGGCSTTIAAVVNEPAVLTANPVATDVQCNGSANGAISLAVNGGTMPYIFSWSTTATTQNLSGLSSGSYSVSITDNHGCTQTASATITEPAVLGVTAASTNVNCNGGANGTATLNVTGGTMPYTFAWSNSAATQNLSGLTAGTYSVAITDNHGCIQNASVTITEPAGMTVSVTSTNVNCNGGATGSATLSVSGGTFPYTFAWSNSAVSQNLSNVAAGTYSVNITDNGGCSQSASVTITEPIALTVALTSTNVSCNGGSNGTINTTVSGGTFPYTYAWSNSAVSQNLSGISAGTYSVTVTDNHGCAQTSSVAITAPAALAVAATATHVNCNGGSNGTASLNVSGGTFPYTYAWSNSASTQNLSNLAAGTYSVTITDNNGCTQTSSITITAPAVLAATSTSTNVNCNGGSNGTASLNVSGGTLPYMYAWSNSASTQNLSNLAAGTYSVLITDNNGCTQTSSVTITAPTALTASATATNVNCNGGNNGAATLTVNGGTFPYTYAWSNSTSSQNLTAVGAGTYSVLITDNNGCTQTSSVTITAPAAINALTTSTNVSCNGGANGTAGLNVSGGAQPYSFQWSNSANTQNITALTAGTYSVLITDNNGCTQTASVIVNAPAAIGVTASLSDVSCNGGANGNATLTVNGGTQPYAFQWSNSATTQNISSLTAGTYSVLITDNNGCTQTQTITITAPAAITSSSITGNASCGICADGTVDFTVNGGNPAYTYAWSNSAGTEDLNGVLPGMYYVTVTDANGCQHTDSALVNFSTDIVNDSITPAINVYPNPSNGENIHITLPGTLNGTVLFTVFDITGQEVFSERQLNTAGEFNFSLPLANGTYIYKITLNGSEAQSGRLVIAK